MSKAYKDFDAFFAEAKEISRLSITLFSKEYFLPPSISASVILRSYTKLKEGSNTFSNEEELILMVETLGEENVKEWSEEGLSQAQLTKIFIWALEEKRKLQLEDVEEVNSGKK